MLAFSEENPPVPRVEKACIMESIVSIPQILKRTASITVITK